MAETRTHRPDAGTKEGGQALARGQREPRALQQREPFLGSWGTPLDLFERMTDEMDRMFDRMWGDVRFPRRSWLTRPFRTQARQGIWAPRIESMQKGDRFIVRAELPGLKRDDVQVELTDEALTIRGERHEEHEEEKEGYYHSERQYGEFFRSIPLPEGVISESATASFRDGILEVTMQAAPAEVSRGRRLEIKDGGEGEQKK